MPFAPTTVRDRRGTQLVAVSSFTDDPERTRFRGSPTSRASTRNASSRSIPTSRSASRRKSDSSIPYASGNRRRAAPRRRLRRHFTNLHTVGESPATPRRPRQRSRDCTHDRRTAREYAPSNARLRSSSYLEARRFGRPVRPRTSRRSSRWPEARTRRAISISPTDSTPPRRIAASARRAHHRSRDSARCGAREEPWRSLRAVRSAASTRCSPPR